MPVGQNAAGISFFVHGSNIAKLAVRVVRPQATDTLNYRAKPSQPPRAECRADTRDSCPVQIS